MYRRFPDPGTRIRLFLVGVLEPAMIAAKVHRDRARADQTAGARKGNARRRKKTSLKASQPLASQSSESVKKTFRERRDQAAAILTKQRSRNVVGLSNRRRSSVVAIVKNRVDMLNMGVIAREVTSHMVSVGCKDRVWCEPTASYFARPTSSNAEQFYSCRFMFKCTRQGLSIMVNTAPQLRR